MKKNKKIVILPLILAALLLAALVAVRFWPRAEETMAAPTPEATLAPTPTPTVRPTATPVPTPEPTPEYFTISMVGDCTLSSSQYYPHFETVMNGDYAHPFSGTADYFKDDYLSIGNLECSFSDQPLTASSTFHFLAPTAHTQILTEGGMDFMTLSNNHTLDFGETGLTDSEKALDEADIKWAAPDGSCVYQTGDGIRVGLYAAKWICTQAEIEAGVSALAQRSDVDIVICLMHWGLEGSYRVTDGQQTLGHAAIDAGADIVYGSHPHVLQRIDEYNGGFVVNSLGNYSFGGNTNPRDRDTAIVQFTVRRDVDGSVTVEGYEAIPCCLSSTAGINDYRPVPYEAGTEQYDRAMSKLLGTFTGPDLTIDYSAYHKNDSAGEATGADAQVPPAD